jgi:2-dehydro-3-deoxyphosphogluconate aldolase/(4S)-4-hydroxy-2-oxoglutarate aldolase
MSIDSILRQQRLLPLFYHDDPEVCLAVVNALYAAGFQTVEFTNRGEQALPNFRLLLKEVARSMPGMRLGVGTVKTARQAEVFIEAGAGYIVAPNMNTQVGALAAQAGLDWIPGCMTPTEIVAAEEAGAGIVKIFPGNLLGPAYLSSIADLFPGLQFVVTGGVDVARENLDSWFRTGVLALGLGSKLISKEGLAAKDYAAMETRGREALALARELAP